MNTERQQHHLTRTLTTALFAGWAAFAVAQPPNMDEINARPDNVGTGAYPAMKEEDSSLAAHVIFRPANLAAMGDQTSRRKTHIHHALERKPPAAQTHLPTNRHIQPEWHPHLCGRTKRLRLSDLQQKTRQARLCLH